MADELKDESEFIDDDPLEFLHQKLGVDSMSKSIDDLSKLAWSNELSVVLTQQNPI